MGGVTDILEVFSDHVCYNTQAMPVFQVLDFFHVTLLKWSQGFDVITSLVSLEHGVYSWEKVTSQHILSLERSGVTSLPDISIEGMHVICCHSNETVWPLWVQRPRRGERYRAVDCAVTSPREMCCIGMHVISRYSNQTILPLLVR
jgi:hypothetical protein